MTLLVEGSFLAVPASVWVAFLSDLVLKSTLLLVLVHLSTRVLIRLPASVRSNIWTTVFVLLLTLPGITVLQSAGILDNLPTGGPGWAVVEVAQGDADTRTIPGNTLRSEAQPGAGFDRGAAASPSGETQPGTQQVSNTDAWSLRSWWVGAVVWLAGLLWFSGRSVYRFCSGLADAKEALPVSGGALPRLAEKTRQNLGIHKLVELRICPAAPVPFVTGFLRPRLVIPACLYEWNERDLRAVLIHEMAHIKRRDVLRLLLADAVAALYWFNPLVWIGVRRSALAMEMACDDIVCQGERNALEYARRLLWFARTAVSGAATARSPGLARRLDLETRMRNILAPPGAPLGAPQRPWGSPRWLRPRGRTRHRIAALGVPALLVSISLPLAALKTVTHEHPARGFFLQNPAVAAGSVLDALPGKTDPAPFSLPNIHEAAEIGDLSAVTRFLEIEPRLIDSRNRNGMTPLALAAWDGHLDLVQLLLDKGADPDIDNNNGLSPLFCAVDRSRGSLARLLIRSGADLDTHGYYGRTLLHMAARSGDIGVARTLIERGADVNAPDVEGVTPLDLAQWHRHLDLAELLRENGAVSSGALPPAYLGKKQSKSTA